MGACCNERRLGAKTSRALTIRTDSRAGNIACWKNWFGARLRDHSRRLDSGLRDWLCCWFGDFGGSWGRFHDGNSRLGLDNGFSLNNGGLDVSGLEIVLGGDFISTNESRSKRPTVTNRSCVGRMGFQNEGKESAYVASCTKLSGNKPTLPFNSPSLQPSASILLTRTNWPTASVSSSEFSAA